VLWKKNYVGKWQGENDTDRGPVADARHKPTKNQERTRGGVREIEFRETRRRKPPNSWVWERKKKVGKKGDHLAIKTVLEYLEERICRKREPVTKKVPGESGWKKRESGGR